MALYKRTMTAAALASCRANAKHSTGPRSARGKARSSLNGFKHGLYSESFAEFLRLRGLTVEKLAVLCALVGGRLWDETVEAWKRDKVKKAVQQAACNQDQEKQSASEVSISGFRSIKASRKGARALNISKG